MDRKTTLTGAALAALALAAGCAHNHHEKQGAKAADPAAAAKGECHGVNECKGKGACGGSGADANCAGQNTCKGLGWLSLTKAECDAKGGTFKGG